MALRLRQQITHNMY